MQFYRITSDGTIKGTKVYDEQGMLLSNPVKRITIDLDASHPQFGIVRVEHIDIDETGIVVPENNHVRCLLDTRVLASLELTIETP